MEEIPCSGSTDLPVGEMDNEKRPKSSVWMVMSQ